MPVSKPAAPAELRRLPGLFRRWELVEVLQPGRQYHIEDAGTTHHGIPLVAVFECIPDLSDSYPADAGAGDAPKLCGPSAPGSKPLTTGRPETVSGARE